ncbi:MAG: TIGR02444 family protein [Alphaproteobacteria bacterium]
MDFPQNPFWDFSIALYAKPGVAPACLDLQERHGLDVNALLFCVWLGESGRGPAPREALAAAFDAVAGWHEAVVRTLRPLRRQLKSGFAPIEAGLVQALRARLQKVEIDAEHVEQLALAASAAAQAPARPGLAAAERAAHAARHVAHYFAHFGGTAGAADFGSLCGIFAAAFDLPAPALRAHLEAAFR